LQAVIFENHMDMEPEIVTTDYTSNTEEAQQSSALVKREAPSTQSLTEQVVMFGNQTSKVLEDLPKFISYFFNAYKQIIVAIGLILVALVAIKLLLTVLTAINSIPLLAPIFKLIGFVYSTWFIYRYLIAAATRQELSATLTNMKEYVLGRGATPSH
jgi:hypothetical protein